MGFFVEKPTPFIPEFLNRMMQLEYPKKRIDLFIHNTVSTKCTSCQLRFCAIICYFSEIFYFNYYYFDPFPQLDGPVWGKQGGLSFKFIIQIIIIVIIII